MNHFSVFLKRNKRAIAACAVVFSVMGTWHFLFSAPADFSAGSTILISRGASAAEVSQELFEAHIIRYPRLFRFILRATGTSGSLQEGAYRFASPDNALVVAFRIVAGAYGLPPVRITLFEGETVRDLSEKVSAAFPFISQEAFQKEGVPYEGYLFPDTYIFQPSATANSIISTLRHNFDAKVAPLYSEINASGHSLSDIVIMASLVEREARSLQNKKIVAGILWNRLKLGMPLQVDAVFGYIFGRDTYSPSYADLKVDSPYNTYTHTGLPPGPISNPGLDSLQAAITPTKSNYLYYLTGTDGLMHYATTYADHQANQKRYLK